MEFLKVLLQVLLIATVPTIAAFMVRYFNAGANDLKSVTASEHIRNTIDIVTTLVSNVVQYVSQTYVDTLKKEDKFSKENQVEAFNRAYNRVCSLLSEKNRETIESVFGNVSAYIITLIEAKVGEQKKLPEGVPVVEIHNDMIAEEVEEPPAE